MARRRLSHFAGAGMHAGGRAPARRSTPFSRNILFGKSHPSKIDCEVRCDYECVRQKTHDPRQKTPRIQSTSSAPSHARAPFTLLWSAVCELTTIHVCDGGVLVVVDVVGRVRLGCGVGLRVWLVGWLVGLC